ncbi:MAG: N-acetylmuramoyl-L-alanine amidase [Clostridia bacterium]|nr:N-acetylmuramoyl-L-alanine amidase [Clostridia bacterium]
MQRNKTQRRFTRRSARRGHSFGTAVAIVLLILIGVGSLMSTQTASARNTPTPSPAPGETMPPFDPDAPLTAASMEPGQEPTDTPAAAPSETPLAALCNSPTPAPEEPVAPVNPMDGADEPEIVIEEPDWRPLKGVIVGIDPGHQTHSNSQQEPVAPGSSETKAKVSSGTQGVKTRIPEYEINLQIALLLRAALEAQGATVYMTREINDVDISNIERAKMMNELGANVVLRLHCNGSDDQSANGIGLFVKSGGDGAAESYAISETLIAAMGEATGARTEPIHVRDNYSGLNWSTVPSILVEMGYQSNPAEDELLASQEYQALLVEGMVNGLTQYFAEHPVPEPSADPDASEEPNTEEASASPAMPDQFALTEDPDEIGE